jgi:hypothetical protein
MPMEALNTMRRPAASTGSRASRSRISASLRARSAPTARAAGTELVRADARRHLARALGRMARVAHRVDRALEAARDLDQHFVAGVVTERGVDAWKSSRPSSSTAQDSLLSSPCASLRSSVSRSATRFGSR